MGRLIGILVTIFCSVMASGGFWAYLQNKRRLKDSRTMIITGLGYDRIVELGTQYIQRGSITYDEYENLHHYIYEPYKELRPNDSTVKKIMDEVDKLPLYHKPPTL